MGQRKHRRRHPARKKRARKGKEASIAPELAEELSKAGSHFIRLSARCALLAVQAANWTALQLKNSKTLIGMAGERKVRRVLRSTAGPEAFLFNNLVIPSKSGTTELDHILVCDRGIFVVETKNLRGWIFGSADDRFWTQKMNQHHSVQFYNPLKQNKGHVESLQSFLGDETLPIISLVVFANELAEIKTEVPDNVVMLGELAKRIQSVAEQALSPESINTISSRLSSPFMKRLSDRLDHITKSRHTRPSDSLGDEAGTAALSLIASTSRKIAGFKLPTKRDSSVDPVKQEPHSPQARSSIKNGRIRLLGYSAALLIILALGAVALSSTQLPPLPVSTAVRHSMWEDSYVLQLTNLSESTITLVVVYLNADLDERESRMLTIPPLGQIEEGWLEGWQFLPGEQVIIRGSGFRELTYTVPTIPND